ncbi:hypothetical protein B0H10DRAFT_1954912 [Mycena sp. CBHHK59/15]|nr:hypothetical protein B0H10DRAFT_1954912 [Mycena sp. CBHHK59/15]
MPLISCFFPLTYLSASDKDSRAVIRRNSSSDRSCGTMVLERPGGEEAQQLAGGIWGASGSSASELRGSTCEVETLDTDDTPDPSPEVMGWSVGPQRIGMVLTRESSDNSCIWPFRWGGRRGLGRAYSDVEVLSFCRSRGSRGGWRHPRAPLTLGPGFEARFDVCRPRTP